MINKENLTEIINKHKSMFIEINDLIWEFAETRFNEKKSSDLLQETLMDFGFSIENSVAGMDTAFIASYGRGKPVIGILGEFDALSELSQESGIFSKSPLVEGGNGHGCGHNTLGTSSMAAAIAVKTYLESEGIEGTIKYYGCPGEEGGSGKTYMVRDGSFDNLDAALTWHPMTYNSVMSAITLANYQIYFKFHGKSSHAAACPHLGRSALDAVELMNIGVNYLREHIIQDARIHYAITNTGGLSPNVVQAESEVLYLIRAPRTDQAYDIYQRVCKIAQGAAMMTETECEIVFDKACSNYVPNNTIGKLMYDKFQEIGPPSFDEGDHELANKIRETFSEDDLRSDIDTAMKMAGKTDINMKKDYSRKVLADTVLPYCDNPVLLHGSTDVGDVSWMVPTAQITTACYAIGTPGHSWQLVSQGSTSLAHKGMIAAAQVMAATAIELLESDDLITKAKQELQDRLDGKEYVSPIPEYVKPSLKR